MNADQFKERTKKFAHRVLNVVESLPDLRTTNVVSYQLTKSGTSVGANYRAACRARSPAEFRAKMGVVEEEADEAAYWLELIADRQLIKRGRIEPLIKEANEIVAMVVKSIQTSRKRER